MANVFESGWRITRWSIRSWEGIVCIQSRLPGRCGNGNWYCDERKRSVEESVTKNDLRLNPCQCSAFTVQEIQQNLFTSVLFSIWMAWKEHGKFLQVDHRYCSIQSQKAFLTLVAGDWSKEDIEKEEDYLDFDLKFPTRRQNFLGINILCPLYAHYVM